MSTPPPSESSSTSTTNSPSPVTPNVELKADPSETLAFLLQTMAAQTSAQHSHSHPQTQEQNAEPSFDSQPDWSQLSAWAAASQDAKYDLNTDFNFSLPMDMDLDFDPNMAVDPSALQFSTIFDQSPFALPHNNSAYLMSNDMVPNLFPTGEEYGLSSHVDPTTGRRLSITSSSSSSGASLSPVIEPTLAISASPPADINLSDPASELAQRVRQMAGVTLAVPVSAQVRQLAAAGGQAKLPIPRLKQSLATIPAPKRSAKPSPPPSESAASPPASSSASTTSSSPPSEQAQSPPSEAPQAPPTQTVIGRPKTSHTTIERRYRTNLNARITGLKQSVPALRVLEVKAGVSSPWNDIVDARGFVDGVKVARKMSKANILGKATEYIRVLKKRETRLKREQDGLKSLVMGLVGGPALLKEWEREWRERFGGEEKDEVEDDSVAGGSDDEEGDGDDSDGEDEEGRPRKKAKVAKPAKKEKPYRPPPPPPVPGVPGAVPEKRKRGRPRKNPLPPAPAASEVPAILAAPPTSANPLFPTDQMMHDAFGQVKTEQVVQPQQPATQQYLLAVFAFFSVFNSPLASSSSYRHPTEHAHAHHGSVLTPHTPTQTHVPVHSSTGYGLHEAVQAAHLLVSTLVFFYVLVPWLSGTLRNTSILSKLSSLSFRSRCDVPAAPVNGPVTKGYAQARAALKDVLSATARGSREEVTQLRSALGITSGVLGLLQSVIKAARRDRGIELNQLEQRAWVRLGELIAFDGTVGNTTRLQTFWCMSWHISTFAASTTDLSTLALIIRPVSASKANELWERARKREFLRAHEKIVLNNMTVEGAADWLSKWRKWHETERKGRCTACEKRTPLGVLAAILIRERLRKHAASLFVRTVVRNEVAARRANPAYESEDECDDPAYTYDADKDLKEEQERKETVEAGKSIGGRTAELATLLDRIWDTGFFSHEDVLPARSPSHSHSHSHSHAHSHAHGRNPDVDADCEDSADLASQDEAEIRALLTATLIYRRIFPSSIPACAASSLGGGAPAFVLSPPPSPSRRNAQLHTALRTALGSPAFESGADGRLEDPELGGALEDARDRVVDMLVDFERACRRGGGRMIEESWVSSESYRCVARYGTVLV
ncbi:hypothetical protein C8Q80DRAFT_1271868 [Daedaleopsis nitida]|nr:hypothetical protein C8Q80DRAFT_1271868 [Daedaleopsis nitida]